MISRILLVFLCSALVAISAGHTSPAVAPSIAKNNGGATDCQSAFGVSDIISNLRGGAVIEGTSAADVDAAILRAGSSQKLVVIDFSATWCGPCKQIAPFFKELSEELTDVVFVKVDVDENPATAAKYSVSAMPTFLFIKGGEVVDRLMGANPARLQELVNQHR